MNKSLFLRHVNTNCKIQSQLYDGQNFIKIIFKYFNIQIGHIMKKMYILINYLKSIVKKYIIETFLIYL